MPSCESEDKCILSFRWSDNGPHSPIYESPQMVVTRHTYRHVYVYLDESFNIMDTEGNILTWNSKTCMLKMNHVF